jgi:hypothetical protein
VTSDVDWDNAARATVGLISGGGELKTELEELRNALDDRTKRLASDISHNNAKIEKLQSRFLAANVGWAFVVAVWIGVESWMKL